MVKYNFKNDCFDLKFRFEVDGEVKYLDKAKELVKPERNTLQVSYQDVEKYNSNLAVTITSEYYRYFEKVFHLIFLDYCFLDGITEYTRSCVEQFTVLLGTKLILM